jgi:hypothetical protein
MTFNQYFMPGADVVAAEEGWASRLDFGPLTMTDVPVIVANSTQISWDPAHFAGVLGLAALKRLDVIIDGAHGTAYLRPKNSRPPRYSHNRLGATFVRSQSRGPVALVLDGTPAKESGIRNGDVLLAIGRLDLTKRPAEVNSYWKRRPGTKLELTLKRDGIPFKVRVTLRDILSPADVNEQP